MDSDTKRVCPHCKEVFEPHEVFLQHLVDSLDCRQHIVVLGAAAVDTIESLGGIKPIKSTTPAPEAAAQKTRISSPSVPSASTAATPPTCHRSGIVITRTTLIVAGSVSVAIAFAVGIAASVAVSMLLNKRGSQSESATTRTDVQSVDKKPTVKDANYSNSTAMTVSSIRQPQVFTSAPPPSVAIALPSQKNANVTPTADVTLNVSSSRTSIYLGESFNLTIEVNGADSGIEAPDLSALSSADIQFLGQHSNSRSSISIINGRMTRESFEGRVFAYQIKPLEEGVFKAGPIQVTAAGKTYTHPGVTVSTGLGERRVSGKLGETKEETIKRYGRPSSRPGKEITNSINTNECAYLDSKPYFAVLFFPDKQGKLISGEICYLIPAELTDDAELLKPVILKLLDLNSEGKKWIEIAEEKHVRPYRRTYRREGVVAYWYPTHYRLKIRLNEYSVFIDAEEKRYEAERKRIEAQMSTDKVNSFLKNL